MDCLRVKGNGRKQALHQAVKRSQAKTKHQKNEKYFNYNFNIHVVD